jgi:hypothetical protein
MAFKKGKDPAEFWREYEAQIGEKVLAYSLGRYLRGWAGLDLPLWGLLIVSSGGFRFHHFPHESWWEVLSRTTTGGDAPKEKTIFIPKERLIAAEFRIERSWWKQLLFASPPLLLIRSVTEEGLETTLVVETEKKAAVLVDRIQELVA